MGLGKTYTGSQAMFRFGNKVNLIVCQKSKVQDWVDHFELYDKEYYNHNLWYDLTDKKQYSEFFKHIGTLSINPENAYGVINYDLIFRRPELTSLEHFTLMLDESSLISNEKAKRTKFILSLQPDNVILLSGTPTAGKYERLWSQLRLLGWDISKSTYYRQYVITEFVDNPITGFKIPVVKGYKNTDRLKD